ncbi:hypothetical protein E4U54_004506 [Claviceps lovelessii]|nr:hypothetical protein E4U54_004506 [Claviceps lovelessii]
MGNSPSSRSGVGAHDGDWIPGPTDGLMCLFSWAPGNLESLHGLAFRVEAVSLLPEPSNLVWMEDHSRSLLMLARGPGAVDYLLEASRLRRPEARLKVYLEASVVAVLK